VDYTRWATSPVRQTHVHGNDTTAAVVVAAVAVAAAVAAAAVVVVVVRVVRSMAYRLNSMNESLRTLMPTVGQCHTCDVHWPCASDLFHRRICVEN
jgi:hypothetical protein